MPDHFATLALPRRPWLEPESVKDAFHRIGAARHPDSPGGDAETFATVNAAWQALREPATRLRHLLELEYPAALAASAPIPAGLAEDFMRMARLRRSLDDFLRREKAATGALEKALLAGERSTLAQQLNTELAKLEATHQTALADLRALDAGWPTRDETTAAPLAALQQQFAFLTKWIGQLREGLFQLGA